MNISRINVPHHDNFTIMSNTHLRDKRLSLKAKGLLSQILSLPSDWDMTISGLVSINLESEYAITSAIRELKQYGYLVICKRYPGETESGRIEYEYNINENPEQERQESDVQPEEKQAAEKQDLKNQALENPGQLNTDYKVQKIKDGLLRTEEEERKKSKEKRAASSESQTLIADLGTAFNGELLEAVQDWLEYKKERHQSYKALGLKALITQLQKAERESGAAAVVDLIHNSIANGYQGIIFDRLGKNSGGSSRERFRYDYKDDDETLPF